MFRCRPGFVAWVLASLLVAGVAGAQAPPPPSTGPFPGEQPLEVPEVPPREEQPPILPPPPPPPEEGPPLSGALRIRLRSVRITGNTVFSEEELQRVAAPYLNRSLDTEGLHALRDALTIHYVNAGYVNSGATIPDQRAEADSIEIRIVEGRLVEVAISGSEYFRSEVLRKRILTYQGPVLNVHDIERALQFLQRDPRILRVTAELEPGPRRGEAVLAVAVLEAFPLHAQLDFGNFEPPSIGSWSGRLLASYDNLFGVGDAIGASFTAAEGLLRGEAEISAPIGPRGTLLSAWSRYSASRIVSTPGNELDIRAEFFEAGAELRHPVRRTLTSLLTGALDFEWRRSRTFILDDIPWSFTPGADEGVTTVSVLRVPIEWTWATGQQVLVARSTLNFGLPILDATVNSGGVEDGVFFSWLLQTQWVRRFGFLDSELVVRGDVQLAADPLLPIERFALGGRYSVRGYRQNLLVRDNGLFGSIEARVPIWHRPDGSPVLQLAPFFDFGRSWNTDRPTPSPEWLAGVGGGLRWFPLRWVYAELYGGVGLVDVLLPPDRDAEDLAIYVRLTLTGF